MTCSKFCRHQQCPTPYQCAMSAPLHQQDGGMSMDSDEGNALEGFAFLLRWFAIAVALCAGAAVLGMAAGWAYQHFLK